MPRVKRGTVRRAKRKKLLARAKGFYQTKSKLYCFGKKGNNPGLAKPIAQEWPKAGPAAQLQIIPSEVYLLAGGSQPVRVRALDANGFVVQENVDLASVKFES